MKKSLAVRVKAKPKHPSPAKGAKKGAGKLRSVRIEPAANGGHTVTHDYEPDEDDNGLVGMYGQKPHVFGDTPSMMKHVGGLFGHNPVAGREPDGDEKGA